MDLTKERDVVKYMSECTSENEWNDRCDEVKAANGGYYPQFWFKAILISGVFNSTTSRWKN